MVTIHDGSPYAQQLQQVIADNFKQLGGKVLSQEAIAPTDVDMHPLLTRIASEKPDLIYFPVFTAAAAQIAAPGEGDAGLEKTTLMGGGSLLSADFIEAAGPSVVGFRIGYPDVSPDAMGKDYPKFVEEYKKAYGEAPISGYHANAYDGAMLAIKAIEKVAKTDKDGNLYIGRKALRDAVFAIKFDGISGPIACDAYGECSQFKPSVLEFTSADPKTFGDRQEPEEDLAVGVCTAGRRAARGPWLHSHGPFQCGRYRPVGAAHRRRGWWSSSAPIGTLIKGRYNAAQWFDFVMFGLTIGSIYAQIALGYTMVYGVLRLINFAHGDIVMTGAFAGYFVATPLDRSGFLESHPVLGDGARSWSWRSSPRPSSRC